MPQQRPQKMGRKNEFSPQYQMFYLFIFFKQLYPGAAKGRATINPREGALPQASPSNTGFFKDHTAVNILSALNKQVKVWLKSEGLSPFGIFWDNRTNVKSVQDGIFTKLHPVLHNLTMQQFLRIEHFKSASRRLPNL